MASSTGLLIMLIILFQSWLFCRLVLAFQPCQQASEKFIIEPADITTYQDKSVNFTCSMRESPSDIEKYLEWRIDPDNEQAQEHQYRDERNGTTTIILTIEATGRSDYFITCNMKFASSIGEKQDGLCFATRRASLTVHYFPKRGDLRCSPNKSTELRIGDIIDLKCSVTRSKPAVDLRWDIGDLNTKMIPIVKDFGRVRYLSSKLLINQEMHLKVFTCVVTSRIAFPSKTLNCSTGPLKVLQHPRVNIYPMRISVKQDQYVGILCEAFAYPRVFEYLWTCQPDHVLNGCDTVNQNANLSLACQKSEDACTNQTYTTVSCTAFNVAGNGTGSINLTIERTPEISKLAYSGETWTECERDLLLNITANIHNKNKDSPIDVTVFCMITGADISSEIKWFFDGAFVNSTDDRFMLNELWKSLYSLQIVNPSQEDNRKEVACKVTACNTTQTASLILSVSMFDIDEIPSSMAPVLPLSRTTSSRAPQSNRLPMWHMVTIASAGVVVTVIITALLVTVIFMCVYRRSEIVTSGTKATTDHDDQNIDLSSLSSNDPSCSDFTYEIPNVLAVPKITPFNTSRATDAIPHYHDYSMEYTYASEEVNETGLSASSQSSWTSDSDTYCIEPGYEMSIRGSRKRDSNKAMTETAFVAAAPMRMV